MGREIGERMHVGAPGRLVAALIAAGLLAGACSSGSDDPTVAAAGSAAGTSGSSSSAPSGPVSLAITPARGSIGVRPGKGVTVVATGGTLRSVVVTSGTQRVSGSFDAQRQSWHSTATLHVSSKYTVTATGKNAAGQTTTVSSWFRTLVPTQTFSAQVSEQAGATYGVGMPIDVTFSRPIRNRVAVERALHVTTSKPVVGVWYWTDRQHVTFRPRDYWPAYTDVALHARLDGVQSAPGVYGTHDVTRQFRIGKSLIVVASTRTHRLHLYRNGTLIHNWPISTGKPGDDTPNGTYLTIEKGNPVEMRPAGIAPGQPGYYDLMVPWAVRFTWSGDYLHDAYWSVAEQGHVNVSHGCVNMPPAAAEAYYKMAVPGDPVTITDSPAGGTVGDGWTDWFFSWHHLLADSALHQAVQAGPSGSTFVDPGSVPASNAKAPLGRPMANNSAAS